ncbi:molybdopterin-guanine dinucleotide biosynthesis protein B [Alicyclobacillus tolerans]|uniref:Molybdopterin-guanine dinucleotide biosynthesis protein B n=1 Tax=Alicyclobacillus tolerans TaxID=90970 RepID=A0ABT9LZE1_9BACL|nr:molybdopterin-guanine dinucleotide biosynthesis protein MobB [Alicyclobacillus tengchongensis]MDP9729638.1 molybdopterin-guanine dinucleotide biosynthesis protein B [Alicyclobacillus tengchongensis]
MPDEMRVAGIVGFSGYGKTTLICRLVQYLASQGQRVAVFKHDGHLEQSYSEEVWPDWQKPGSDTDVYARAGAASTVLFAAGHSLYYQRLAQHASSSPVSSVEQANYWLERLAMQCQRPQFVLVEGVKDAPWPKLAIAPDERRLLELLRIPMSNLRAVVLWNHSESQLDKECSFGDMNPISSQTIAGGAAFLGLPVLPADQPRQLLEALGWESM